MNDAPRAQRVQRLAVIGAGNMGSGIAQKMATEGLDVTLVDLDQPKVDRGMQGIRDTLAAGVARRIFRPEQTEAILGRIRGTSDWSELADVDLVVEAVFEDLDVKRDVFRRLAKVCRPDAILGTNTSSFSVTEIAAGSKHPERVVGLHYFYHPAKNRLVEVVPGKSTSDEVLQRAWQLQERMGKTPIRSADASGFVVNRYFVPWLNEAVRLVEESVADLPTIEAACKQTFGIGMGPFELMNVTGIPIALHAATTLGGHFGSLYAPCDTLRRQVESGKPWNLEGEPQAAGFEAVAERMLAVVFLVAAALVDEGVGTIEDTDIGARVGLRWPKGPFEMINRHGVKRAATMAAGLAGRHDLEVPRSLRERAETGRPFEFRLVKSEIADGVAVLTVNRPDAMNALNEDVVAQLHGAFREVAADPQVRGIVLAGAGKAFVAGADIRFFVRNIDAGDVPRIVRFTRAGHDLLNDIDRCPKPVVARVHGLTLGGGLELALACDRIVASPRASMAFPETGIGIYPGLGGTQRTPRRVGAGLAKWLIYTGSMLTAAEACEIGLVDEVAAPNDLDGAVRRRLEQATAAAAGPGEQGAAHRALAAFFEAQPVEKIRRGEVDGGGDERIGKAMRRVASKAPIALGLAEKLIDAAGRGTLEQGLQMELDHLVEIFGTRDAYEGLSTLGKKKPEFTGS